MKDKDDRSQREEAQQDWFLSSAEHLNNNYYGGNSISELTLGHLNASVCLISCLILSPDKAGREDLSAHTAPLPVSVCQTDSSLFLPSISRAVSCVRSVTTHST